MGTWAGGLAYSQVLATLFLSIGAGAVFQVAYEIGWMIRQESQTHFMPLTVMSGVAAGMLVLYVAGLLIK